MKFNSLPTTSGWPTAAWRVDPLYTLPSNADSTEFPYTTGFAVDGGLVGLTWLFDPGTYQGKLQTLNASTGASVSTYSPMVSGAYVGYFDNERSIEAQNGWFWLEDDWFTRIVGFCPSGACT
jgi:hypothetical protein